MSKAQHNMPHSPALTSALLTAVCLTAVCLAFFTLSSWAGPLHDAAEVGDLARARQLIESKSADIDEIDQRGIWPLLAATTYGNTDMVKLLLALHANPNRVDQYGYSALHEAAGLGYPDVVEILIHAKGDLNARDINDITPLGYAMRSSSEKVVTLLKSLGATQ